MRKRREIHFVSARREINTSFQQAMKDLSEAGGMMRRNLINSPNWIIRFGMQPEDRCIARYLERQAFFLKRSIQIVAKLRSLLFQLAISIHSLDLLKHRQPGAHSHRIRA